MNLWYRLYDNVAQITKELESHGIQVIQGDSSTIQTVESGEEWRREKGGLGELVPVNTYGKLGNFCFIRTCSGWVVNGPVPLLIAEKLYAMEDLRKSICVGCNPLGPPPAHAYVHVVAYLTDPDQVPWLEIATNDAEYESLRTSYPNNFSSSPDGWQGYKFYERNFHVREDGCVHLYSLNDIRGMMVFLEAIRPLV